MSRRQRLCRSLGLFGLAALALGFSPLPPAGRPAAAAEPDVTKQREIEPAARLVVRNTAAVPAAAPASSRGLDVGKTAVIEPGVKHLVAARSAPTAPTTPPAPAAADNPKVAPGKVRWHTSFAEACAAAGRSGRPVLLFQLMGRLDDRFC